MAKTVDSREQLPIPVLYLSSWLRHSHVATLTDGRTQRVAKQRIVTPAQKAPNHTIYILVFRSDLSFPVRKTLKASVYVSTLVRHLTATPFSIRSSNRLVWLDARGAKGEGRLDGTV